MSMHETVAVRKATVRDVEALLRLRGVMFSSLDRTATAKHWEGACRQILLDGLTSGDLLAAVAETDDGTIVASGIAAIHRWLPSPANPSGLKGYIGSMATEQEWRRLGIGRRIANHLVRALHERGIAEIEVHATEDGEGIYRSLGFTARDDRTPLAISADAD
jgi:GNAT superfamily N-acetyltransferase